jgi:hypothetical protein
VVRTDAPVLNEVCLDRPSHRPRLTISFG